MGSNVNGDGMHHATLPMDLTTFFLMGNEESKTCFLFVSIKMCQIYKMYKKGRYTQVKNWDLRGYIGELKTSL